MKKLNKNELKNINIALKENFFLPRATQKNTSIDDEDNDIKYIKVTFPHIKVFITLLDESVVDLQV